MSDFEINLTEVEESGSFDLMPVGDYEFVASGWENKTSNKVATILCFVFKYTSLRVLPANLQPTEAPRINKPKSIL